MVVVVVIVVIVVIVVVVGPHSQLALALDHAMIQEQHETLAFWLLMMLWWQLKMLTNLLGCFGVVFVDVVVVVSAVVVVVAVVEQSSLELQMV